MNRRAWRWPKIFWARTEHGRFGGHDHFAQARRGKERLWVVITNPDPRSGEIIMVNLTTQRPHSDATTVLPPGEHPFIDRPTVASYHDAR